MDDLFKQEQLKKILDNILEATDKNIIEKRRNFEHITLLTGTILGFSVGLTTITSGEPNLFLVFSWITDVIALIIGSVYLIIEAESRYYRTFIFSNKQIDLFKLGLSKEGIQVILDKFSKEIFDISSGKNIKEKIFIAFAKYQRRIEAIFYLIFILSLILLVISFFLNNVQSNLMIYFV